MQVLVKWYNIYNAPGGPSAHAEWNQFVTCFMALMGYNTERLSWTQHVSQAFLFCFNLNWLSMLWAYQCVICSWCTISLISSVIWQLVPWSSSLCIALFPAAFWSSSFTCDRSQEGSTFRRRIWWGWPPNWNPIYDTRFTFKVPHPPSFDLL